MRVLSYPEPSEVDTDNEVPLSGSFPAPEVESHPDDVWADEIFHFSPPKAKKSKLPPPPQKSPNKRKPKRSKHRLTMVLLFLAVLGVAAGVTHYWKEITVAGYFALAWLLLAAVVVLAVVVYRVLLYLLKIAGVSFKLGRRILFPAIFIFTAVYVWRVAPWLPVVDNRIDAAVSSRLSNVRPHFIYESSDGREVYSEGSRLVGEDEMWNSYLKSAIINIEDERYAERIIPIDPRSVIRAAYKNAKTKKREGASTLQIQIVDLLFEDFDSAWLNKGFEWLMALRLDAKMPDRATQLAVYANLIPGNDNTQGAAALAADLFNISDLRKLTPEQAALIAGSLKGGNYNPRLNRSEALTRRNIVLKKMHDHGDIDAEQYGAAVRTELQIESPLKPYEYFVRAAQTENADFFDGLMKQRVDFRGGPTIEEINSKHNASPIIRVKLSLDMELQQIAERRIADPIRRKTLRGNLPATTDVAFVVIENDTGRIRAAIPALKGELDITRRTQRDLGFTWKTLQAAAALTRHAITPQETFADTGPMKFGGQVVHNYGNSYSGLQLSIVDCLARSSNVCAMQVQQRLSASEWRAAITSLNLPLPRRFDKIGIGDAWPVPMFRLASAYTALPNGGEMVMPSYIASATAEEGVVEAPVMRRKVFEADACKVVLEGMEACLTRGTGRAAASSQSSVARGKTGTTQDSLAVLQTRKITMAVWVGDRKTNRDLKQTGGALAMRLLVEFLREVRKTRPELAPQF